MIRQAEHLQTLIAMKNPREGILCLLSLLQEHCLQGSTFTAPSIQLLS
jgi:hypothetical protein